MQKINKNIFRIRRQYHFSIFFGTVVLVMAVLGVKNVTAKGVQVDRVADGETIVFSDGTYGALYGVDAPDMGTKDCLSKKSKKKLARLIKDKNVTIKNASADLDQFGRRSIYVYRHKKFINALLIKSGLAKTTITATAPSKREQKLIEAQELAQSKNRGVWSKCTQEQTTIGSSGGLGVRLRFANSVLDRGDKTTVAVTTSPRAQCSVTIDYEVDPTQIDMGPKTADAEGNVDFYWRTPPTIDPGVWPYTVKCTLNNKTGEYRGELQIFLPH